MAQGQGGTATIDAPDTLPADFFEKKQQGGGEAPDTLPGNFFEKKQATATPAAKPGLLDSAFSKGNEYAGKFLSAAGLPTSLSDVPHWTKGLFGQNENSQPFWKPAQEAIQHPSQESIVGAVPLIGPGAVSMSHDVRAGHYGDAAATLAGTIAPLAAGAQVKPGLRAAKSEVAEAARTPDNKLTPIVKAGSKLAVGGAGAATGVPGLEVGGFLSGVGPAIADKVLPNRPAVPDFHGGAFSEFEGESGKPIPITRSPDFDPGAFKEGAAERTTGKPKNETVGSPIVAPTSAVPESEGRPATWKNEKVADLSGRGGPLTRPAAVQAQLRQLDVPNLSLIADPHATMTPSVGSPKSVTHFDLHGNPTPFGESLGGHIGEEPEIELMDQDAVGSRINGSGDSDASMEAITRQRNENASGVKYFREDPGGKRMELTGPDRQDAKAYRPGERVVRVDGSGNETVLHEKPRTQRSTATRTTRQNRQE